jgi:hypothetical protein
MIDIKKCVLDINSNLKVSDVSNFDNEKLKKTIDKCCSIKNVVMFSILNDENKEYIQKCYEMNNYLKSIQVSSSQDAILNRLKYASHNLYMNTRRQQIVDATDKSNLNELNIDYYHDTILESKYKNKKFSFDITEEPVDLNKELTNEYIQECKNSEIKINKLKEKIEHKIYKKIEVLKYKSLDQNYTGIIFYHGLFELIYEDTNENDIKEIFEKINKTVNENHSEKMNENPSEKIKEKIEELKLTYSL